ncbi:hypothetical protein MYCTH_97124 [Thermothelomyces thermophilus ATCC 42464]|uniref:Uncharacterized protein n=1 Tax=Thermothelomyces thermophilus (strain ATCC 42464 / BCRC 31852 / DSM 1799) TaxID=573729 RepID=G2QNQ3_THET4|nr:uncharacterized protein MYCTH_97124 [Thermothelomyces thermophilus ATCC 42464]AEO61277.1 hypothetical protein MYCTH_97124 [Thermothelomyces thermophilus ATCC 42464]
MQDLILLVFNLGILTRVLTLMFTNVSAPGCAELGCTSFADIIGILLAIFGGIFMMLGYGRTRECGTDDCDALRSYPAGPARDTASFLLYAASGHETTTPPVSVPTRPYGTPFDTTNNLVAVKAITVWVDSGHGNYGKGTGLSPFRSSRLL